MSDNIADRNHRRRAATLRRDDRQRSRRARRDSRRRLQFHHATGAVDDKAAFLAKMAAGRIRYAGIAWSEEKVTALADDAALLTGRMTTDVQVEGTDKRLNNRVMTVWRRSDGDMAAARLPVDADRGLSAMHPQISINTLCLPPAALGSHVEAVARLGARGISPVVAEVLEFGVAETARSLRDAGLEVATLSHISFGFATPRSRRTKPASG